MCESSSIVQAGYMSKNFDYERDEVFIGNSFITGADESLEEHVTVASNEMTPISLSMLPF